VNAYPPLLRPGRTRKRRFESFAAEMREALDNMQSAVADSYVDGGKLDHEDRTYALKAWGVWVHRAHHDRDGEPQGQNGILGTSAALELMSSTREFRDDITREDRQKLLIGSWLYLYDKLAVPTRSPVASTGRRQEHASDVTGGALSSPPDPRGTLVVRQSQVLRALSALEHHLTAVLQRSGEAAPMQENQNLAAQVLDELQKCRVPDIPVDEYPALREVSEGSDALAGYSYLSGSSGSPDDRLTFPETPIEWAYLLGSVLVCLSRAYLAYFLTVDDFAKYVNKADITRLARWVQKAVHSDNPDKLRVGLFAGWSILQMDLLFESDADRFLGDLHTGSTGGIVDSRVHNTDLALSAKQRRSLTSALREGARSVIDNPSLQADLHHPYSFHIAVADGKSGDPYRQDHLVVPTVPIALWLIARLDERALFDSRVETLARRVASCFEDPHNPRVAPGQSSTYNGTVNMNYLHEAVAEIHDLARRTANRSSAWRVRAAVRRPRPTWDRVSGSPKVALGFALFLVLLVGPMIAWLWGKAGIVPGGDKRTTTPPITLTISQGSRPTHVTRISTGQRITVPIVVVASRPKDRRSK
jgi:hypothetical protein